MPGERSLKLLFIIGGILIAALAIVAAFPLEMAGDSVVFDLRLLLASIGAAMLASLISLANRIRRHTYFYPRWFMAVTVAKVASLVSVALLILAMAATWMSGLPAWNLFFRALILLVVAFTHVSFWSSLLFQLYNLLPRPNPRAPRSASRSPPPPPGT